MNRQAVGWVILAMMAGAAGGWWLRAAAITSPSAMPAPPTPEFEPAPSPAASAPPSTLASLPVSLPPRTLPPLPPASGADLDALRTPTPPAAAPAKPRWATHAGQRIREHAHQVPGVRSLAWGDGAQLYVLVENRTAQAVAGELCRRFAQQEPQLVIMAQETQARAGKIVSIQKRCS